MFGPLQFLWALYLKSMTHPPLPLLRKTDVLKLEDARHIGLSYGFLTSPDPTRQPPMLKQCVPTEPTMLQTMQNTLLLL